MVENTKKIKVTACMTCPRYENTWARNYIEKALQGAGIPLAVSGGVFYGQCMQMMLEQAIDDGCDVAITVDFDSVFTTAHVSRLLSILTFNDEIDAVCGMQCRRGAKTPLVTKSGERSAAIVLGETLEVSTAHFGLTAIDLHKLKGVQKPWFQCQPDSEGRWSDKKIDDDIWFWLQWAKAGNSIHMATDVQIGHLEEVVTHFVEQDGQFQAIHSYPKDWSEKYAN